MKEKNGECQKVVSLVVRERKEKKVVLRSIGKRACLNEGNWNGTYRHIMYILLVFFSRLNKELFDIDVYCDDQRERRIE